MLDTDEVLRALGIGLGLFRKLVRRGELRVCRVSRQVVRVSAAEIERFVAAHSEGR